MIKFVNIVLWLLGSVLIIFTFILIGQSLNWPLVWDAPGYHYIAWMMSKGAVPYKDIFDQQFPGTYLVHLFVIKFLGTGSIAWRFTDLFCLALIDITIVAYMKKYGALSAIFAACLFSIFHLLNGAFHAGQRDYFTVLSSMAGVYFLASALEHNISPYRLLLAGFAVGAGIMIKPQVGVLLFLLAIAVAASAYSLGRSWLPPMLIFFASGFVVPAAILIWLAAIGGLIPFFDIVYNYLAKVYLQIGDIPLIEVLLATQCGTPLVVDAFVAGAISLVYCSIQKHIDIRRGLLVLGLAYGLYHHLGQRADFLYHTYPLALFIFLLTASWIRLLQNMKRGKLYFLMLGFLLYLSIGFAVTSIQRFRTPLTGYYGLPLNTVFKLVNDLKDRLAPGDKIQTFFYGCEATHALFLLQRPQATRFVFTFHLFYLNDNPYIKKIRAEFLNALKKEVPKILVFSHVTADGEQKNYDYIRQFPALYAWINENYRLAFEDYDYRIYELNRERPISSSQ